MHGAVNLSSCIIDILFAVKKQDFSKKNLAGIRRDLVIMPTVYFTKNNTRKCVVLY